MTMSSSKPTPKPTRNVPPPQGDAAGVNIARGASAYSRFIPREELGAFAAWKLDTLNAELDTPEAALDIHER